MTDPINHLKEETQTSPALNEGKPYEPPTLTEYGGVVELTLGGMYQDGEEVGGLLTWA